MNMDPPPPRMSLDDYADWMYANLTHSKNKAEQLLQKQIQEPPLAKPFRVIDDPGSPQVGESTSPWPKSS